MPASVLEEELIYFAELSQTTYALTEDYMWCFSYTIEGDMFFGMAPA